MTQSKAHKKKELGCVQKDTGQNRSGVSKKLRMGARTAKGIKKYNE